MTSRLSKFEEFALLAQREGIDVKPTLLHVLTDFYVQKATHTAEEDQHFCALALRLIDEVDPQTRASVAAKLTAYGAAPAPLLAKLEGAPHTPPAIAPPTVEAEPRPSPALVSDEDKAAAARFSDMFFQADSDQRRAVLRELDRAPSAAPLTIPPDEAKVAIERLEIAALRGRPFEFVLEVERVLAVPRRYAEAIIKDASGEPMLVLAKAIDMPIDVVQRLLLLVNPLIGASVRRVFDLCALYEELSPQAALRLVSLWRHASVGRPITHQPMQTHAARDPRSMMARARIPTGTLDKNSISA